MLAHQRLELAAPPRGTAERQFGVHALLDRHQPQLLEPGDLSLRERLVGEVRPRRPAPQPPPGPHPPPPPTTPPRRAARSPPAPARRPPAPARPPPARAQTRRHRAHRARPAAHNPPT